MLEGNLATNWHPIQGGVVILLVAVCCGSRDKLRMDGSLSSITDLSSLLHANFGQN